MTIYDEIIADNPSGYWDLQSLSGQNATDNSFYANTALVGGDLVQYPQAANSYKSIELGPGNMLFDDSMASISGDLGMAISLWSVGATAYVSSVNYKTAPNSMKVVYTSGAQIQIYSSSGLSSIPITPGKQYTAKMSCLSESVTRSCFLQIGWYRNDGVFISTNPTATITTSNTVWTDYTITATAPSNAAFATMLFNIASPTTGDTHYVDEMGFFQGSVSDFAYPNDNVIKYSERKTDNLVPANHAAATSTVTMSYSGGTPVPTNGEFVHTASSSAAMYSYNSSFTVEPGKTYTASTNITEAGRAVWVYLQFLDSSVTVLTNANSMVSRIMYAGNTGRISVTAMAPPGAATARVYYAYTGAGATNDVIKYNQLSFVENTLVDFALPGETNFIPVNNTESPVRPWTGVADKKPFVFECIFRPESYESSVALYESYKNYGKSAAYLFNVISGSTTATCVSKNQVFPGTQIFSTAGLHYNTFVRSVSESSFAVTGAVRDATTVTYTVPGHNFAVNEMVNISGVTPSTYNFSMPITSVGTDTFTITKTQSNNAYVSGGIATMIKAELSRPATSTYGLAEQVFKIVNNSGIYYENGQIIVKLCGRTKSWEYTEDKVVYNVPEIASYHLAVRISDGQVDIYLDGTLVKSSAINVPDYFYEVDGYRTRQIHGKSWISNVAVYNSDVKIDLIKNHAHAQTQPQDNLLNYFSDDTTYFDISNNNGSTTAEIKSPEKNRWESYTRNNVSTDGSTLGLVAYKAAEAVHPESVTFATTDCALTSTGIKFSSISQLISNDFAISGTFKFNGYTQSADSFDTQRFYVYDLKSNTARLSVFRELKDVSGTLKSYLTLEYINGDTVKTESIDYTSYGTSFPTTVFNIMIKRKGNWFVLSSYDVSVTTTKTATIEAESSEGLDGATLYIGASINDDQYSYVTVSNVKAVKNLNDSDDLSFMTATTIMESCSLPLNLTSEYKVYQRGNATIDLVSSKFDDDGVRDLTVDLTRVSWSPELSNIVVQTSVDDGANYSAAIDSGAKIPTFTNNGDATAEITTIKASFETYDSEDDLPRLYSLSAELENLGKITSLDRSEQLYVYGNYMLPKLNSYPIDCTKNTGLRFANNGGFYYAPDISRDNIISNWSFSDYDGWTTTNGLEEVYADPSLNSGYGFRIPFTTNVTLTSTEKCPVVASQPYSACIYVKATAAATATLSINWYKDDDTSAGTATASASHTLSNAITPVYISGTAPATTAYAKISVVFASATAQDIIIDSAVFNEGSTTVPVFVDNQQTSFTPPHQYKSVGMLVRPESGFSQTGTYTLFDYYDGVNRYRINNDGTGLKFTGFNKVYVNGVDTAANTLLPTAGWQHIVGTLTNDFAIYPQTNRKANFGMTYTNTEYGYWSFDSVWLQKTTATATTTTNDYKELFGKPSQAIDDTLGSSMLVSEDYRTIITPRTLIPSSQ